MAALRHGALGDADEPEAFLKRIGESREAPFDLGEAALALAKLARPELDLAPYRRHLSELVGAVAGTADPSRLPVARSEALVRAIAREHGYKGDRDSYDDLANADLARVIERRRGIPVSLGILYIHTARGQGWAIDGLNTPGHFLVRLAAEAGEEEAILDPFSGRRLEAGDAAPPVAEDRAVLLRLENNIKTRLIDQERYEEAGQVLERMLWIEPRAGELWWESALIDAELGRITGAIGRLDRCLALATGADRRSRAEALQRALRAKLN
jgi:regulator of sirC expression with transglutaminase-like and TPR domain